MTRITPLVHSFVVNVLLVIIASNLDGNNREGVRNGAAATNVTSAKIVVVFSATGYSRACENVTTGRLHTSQDSGGKARQDDVTSKLVWLLADTVNSALLQIFNGSSSVSIDVMVTDEGCDPVGRIIPPLLKLQASSQLTGVITMTSSGTADQLADILRYLNIPVVELVAEDVLTKAPSGQQHFILPHSRYWLLQSVFEMAHLFNWTALSIETLIMDTLTSSVMKNTFKSMAVEEKMCLLPAYLNDVVSFILVQNYSSDLSFNPFSRRSGVTVLFSESELDDIYWNREISNKNSTGEDSEIVLFLYPVKSKWSPIVHALNHSCPNTASININQSPGVSNFDGTLNPCTDKKLLHEIPTETKTSIESLSLGMSFLFKRLGLSDTLQTWCKTNTDPLVCDVLNADNVNVDLDRRVVFMGDLTFQAVHMGDQNNDSMSFKTNSLTIDLIGQLPSSASNKDGGVYKPYCSHCVPKGVSDTKMLSSGDGYAYIVGFFPIHLSTHQAYCSKPNPVGYAAALAFLEGMKSYANTSSVNGEMEIQGLVFDSCGLHSQIIHVIDQLETCSQAFQDQHDGLFINKSLEPSSIIAYVDGLNDLGESKLSGNTDKLILSIDKSGFSTSGDLNRVFVENAGAALTKIAWTVINVVVSDQQPFKSIFSHLKQTFPVSHNFCLIQEIILYTNSNHRNSSYHNLVSEFNNTPVFFLLTNEDDTKEVIQYVNEYVAGLQQKASFIFTPWNKHLNDLSSTRAASSVNILFSSSTQLDVHSTEVWNSMSNVFTTTLLTPWSENFNLSLSFDDIVASDKTEVQMVLQGTRDLLTALRVDMDSMPSSWTPSTLDLSSTGMDVGSYHVYRGRQVEIAHIDKVVTRKAAFTGPVHDVCKGWCAKCNTCRTTERSRRTSLFMEGDVIVTGLFPLHTAGADAFTCGSVQDNQTEFHLIQAFMFAIETAPVRYPDLLPGLKMGGLVLDTCSNSFMASQVLGDFETCVSNFGNFLGRPDGTFYDDSATLGNKFANPTQNVAYLVEGNANDMNSVIRTLGDSKYTDAVLVSSGPASSEIAQENEHLAQGLVKILKAMKWNKVIIVVEQRPNLQTKKDALVLEIYKANVCVIDLLTFETNQFWTARNVLRSYSGFPIVLLARRLTTEIVFTSMELKGLSFFWIIPVTSREWQEFPSVPNFFPPGTIVVDAKSKQNEEFSAFLYNSTVNDSLVMSLSSWYRDLWRLRFACDFRADRFSASSSYEDCPLTSPTSDLGHVSPAAHDVIKNVDAILHGVHAQYVTKCPEKSGICEAFASYLRNGPLAFLPGVKFSYQGEQLEYNSDRVPLSELSIFNRQRDGFVQVGSFFKSLAMDATRIRLYTPEGLELTQIPEGQCDPACTCKDVTLSQAKSQATNEDHLYHPSQGAFIGDLWCIIVVAVAGSGAFMSIVFGLYVVYKVCRGALGKRYVGLGLSLLLSLTLLYLTVLPFLFTPNETVCGLRYLLSGIAYAFCFAVIFVKLMSLQSYKLIGLGGELSALNQFLTVVFVVGVQVAISVQWWLHSTPTFHSIADNFGIVQYACNFHRKDYVLYHIYIMLLIVLSSLYAILVRKEKKNMKEARLLLACTWTCVFIWAAWLLCLFLLDRKWSDVLISAAILACASTVMFIVFIPKIRMVSRLKYDLSQKANFRNGYSVDTDFLYERPYSLPGTLTSTFSSGKMNYPKTFSNFDSDVNY